VSLAWVAVAGITIQSLFSIRYYYGLPVETRENLESLTEHANSLLYVWVLLLALAVCLLRGCSRPARVLLVIAAIPTAYVFVLSQRRAGVIALGAGFVVLAIVLFFRRRKAFLVVVPLVALLTVGYTAAFWNTTDGIGFGAQAIKSVVAPGSLSAEDKSSDLYRDTERYNIVYTMRAEPLTGVGFGKPFYQPAALPYIIGFGFSEYTPHNAILWIWLKMGFLGFVVLLFMIAATIRAGVRASMRLVSGHNLAVTAAALAFVVMFVIFGFVDLVWAPQTAVFFGICIATCANILRLADKSGETLVESVDDEPEFESDLAVVEDLALLSAPPPK
jgi:O-antigen ligase